MVLDIKRKKSLNHNGTRLNSLQSRIEKLYGLYKVNVFEDTTCLTDLQKEVLKITFLSKEEITLKEIGEEFGRSSTWAANVLYNGKGCINRKLIYYETYVLQDKNNKKTIKQGKKISDITSKDKIIDYIDKFSKAEITQALENVLSRNQLDKVFRYLYDFYNNEKLKI